MKPGDIIRNAKDQRNQALSEADSKRLLSAFGVPVVKETVAATPEQAAEAAQLAGFPVVLKGLGAKLTHKTELGLVRLGLKSAAEVAGAAKELASLAGPDLEGFLVQPQVAGRREFAAGLFHDPQFGPVVMFGVGGVLAEAFNDVVFRLAPVTGKDVDRMLSEIRAQKLLGSFRGDGPIDTAQVAAILDGLFRAAGQFPEISEIDVNPLIADKQGRLTAVDALVMLGGRPSTEEKSPPVLPERVGKLVYPKSIAFVGASARFGKWGHTLFTSTLAGGYKGDIFLVNPKGGTILNKPVYKSVCDLPKTPDLAVITVPAPSVAGMLSELEKKGVKSALLISSGFGETGATGKVLERDIARRARAADILVMGPNTMGLCNPHAKLYCMGSHVRPSAGSTALVAQSGNMGVQLLAFAVQEGIGIRAFCGSGNEAILSIEDFLEGFEVDRLTETVVLYIESVKNGRRFYESARRVGKKKPVVVLKGGRTEAGGRAAASHTGALASDTRVFDAACRQAGIVRVDRPVELLDLSAAFSSLPLPRGNRVAIMTLGGGWGVVAADLCSEYSLELPDLSPALKDRISTLLPPYWSHSNPVDLVGERDFTIFMKVTEELMAWDGCDAVINLGIRGRRIGQKRVINSMLALGQDVTVLEQSYRAQCDSEARYTEHLVKLMEKYQKPILGVPLVTDDTDRTLTEFPGWRYKALFFQAPERAVKALSRMYEYSRFRREENSEETGA